MSDAATLTALKNVQILRATAAGELDAKMVASLDKSSIAQLTPRAVWFALPPEQRHLLPALADEFPDDTLLHIAVRHDRASCVKLLLADTEIRSALMDLSIKAEMRVVGETIDYEYSAAGTATSTEVMQALIDAGCSEKDALVEKVKAKQ